MGSAEQEYTDEVLHELSIKAAEMIGRCAAPPPGWDWPYNRDALQGCLRTAMTEAQRDERSSDQQFIRFLAAHVACRLVRHTDAIFKDGIPTSSDKLVDSGAASFMSGWATQVAIFSLNFDGRLLSEDEADPPAVGGLELRADSFMSVLDELVAEPTAKVHHRVVPDLVDCIDDGSSVPYVNEPSALAALLPEAEPPQPAASSAAAPSPERPPTSPAPAAQKPTPTPSPPVEDLPTPPASTTPPSGETSPPPFWKHPAVKELWRKPAVKGVALIAAGAVLGAAAIHQLTASSSSSASTPVTTTVTTTAASTGVPAPLGPELAFAEPTLDRIALRLYAYPDDSARSERVMAVPEHPAQARAVMNTSQDLIVEIHLAARPNALLDPNETFDIGLAASGLLTLIPRSSRVSNPGAEPLLPLPKNADLTPAPTTQITLDPGGAETVYTVRLKAKAQPRVLINPSDGEPAYFCGFNTQNVNAVIVSSTATEVAINTTLPVAVLRTGSSC